MPTCEDAETVLIRDDPDMNMHRFYGVSVVSDLFGLHVLVVRWGRQGRAGRMRIDASGSRREMSHRLSEIVTRKVLRGYAPLGEPCKQHRADGPELPLFERD
ncbi:WGR domain protein [Jannaschia seosinensis]|uniref:WGR domain protein n=1 Tax=Jannaschia seosinensis TaxID=313367 RepID=A0A0M7BDF8_9RHOB|nr:WGR domain-containing protein [Jannaschia seosinensis]CUH39385.1 WGR domain protein [Jannaschia seosinensis]